MEGKSRNFREYKVWQDAVAFAAEVYGMTNNLPWFEKKGMGDQLQRAVVSISSNIAEGSARPSKSDFAHFLDIALGSCFEVETQLIICQKVGYLSEEQSAILIRKVQDIQIQLNYFISAIRKHSDS